MDSPTALPRSIPSEPDARLHKGRLCRLDPLAYTGRACVHWTMSLEKRASGWLDDLMHARLREILLHVCARYSLVCPAYCLMPDHAHFLVMGIGADADQRPALRMLRRQWTSLLPHGMALQRQSYDHVLREKERARGAFESVAHYILENPVRAGLVAEYAAWPYAGSLVPGFHSLNPRAAEFWTSFWLVHEAASS